jgi:isoleucyl-tRNA synthetase
MIALLRKAAYTPLDRWLLSELHGLIQGVSEAYERYDVTNATRRLQAFVQQLDGWYLPRARARFQQPLSQPGTQAAYAALYEVLVTLSRLSAPAVPFLAEELYQALLHRVDEKTAESVHLTTWPSADVTLIDPHLNRQMALVQALSTLGSRARREAGLRPGQPLSDAIYILNTPEEADTAGAFADLLAEAINVKTVYISISAGDQVDFSLRPRTELLEDKHGTRFNAIRDSLILLEPESTARQLLDGDPLKISLDGEPVLLLPEEIELRLEPKAGHSIAHAGAHLVLLNLELTPELRQEGLALEFIQQVLALRRTAGVGLANPIDVRFEAGAELARAVLALREQVQKAAGADSLAVGAPLPGMASTQVEIQRQSVVIGLQPAASAG